MYISKIEDEKYYEDLISEEDFRRRSVLKIIIENKFEHLMDDEDPKAENLMLKIWHGKESTKCDGSMLGYSCMSHIIWTHNKVSTNNKKSILDRITNNF